ncbi:MAG: hypothetical protein KGQ66_09995 [Acidobacteriota bacterium]|nr:hypothetical protein [Acidobacteriota bacterium]
MLLDMDEFPYHQITQTFAGVGGSDPQWNDGHYICACDEAGTVALASNVRLYQNNDVLDGFVCIRHRGRQHNIRLSRRLRPDMNHLGVGPLHMEVVEPMKTVRLVLEPNEYGISLDLTCHTVGVPYMGPIEVNRVDGRLLGERATYELAGRCKGWVEVDGDRTTLETESSAFFRNHSWGYQGGRGGPRYGAPTGSKRHPGVRQWVLFSMPDHSGFYFEDPSGRSAAGRGAILQSDRPVPVAAVRHDLEFYPGGGRVRRGSFELDDAEGTTRSYTFEDLGWVYCQGGGYFGGFNDGLGQGVFRGDLHTEGEVWDVSHPTLIEDVTGRQFEFDHAWAESFVKLAGPEGQTGLAHFECVVVADR